jgi:DegV family protein with EDD domain
MTKLMENKKIKIVCDSASDIRDFDGIDFASAPLKICTAEKEYVDDLSLDAEQMTEELERYNGRSRTSCPNPEDWLGAFGDADLVFCITITATLSGSYNSAMVAKNQYEEMHEGRRVFVLNSLSTGPEMILFAEKIRELVLSGLDFDGVCAEVERYTQSTGLIFVLSSIKNLANNGRVNKIVASMAGILGIRMVGKASEVGDLQPLAKCRGEKNALETVIKSLKDLGLNRGKVHIGHSSGASAAVALGELIAKNFPNASVDIYKCRGLCSFYAEKGGLLIGFEKF